MRAAVERSSHKDGIGNASRRASTPAAPKRASPHSMARRFASEPVGRPPISSVSDCRSETSGVSPSRAAASRAESSARASAGMASARAASSAFAFFMAEILAPGRVDRQG